MPSITPAPLSTPERLREYQAASVNGCAGYNTNAANPSSYVRATEMRNFDPGCIGQ
jgi:hypothetical protein